MNPATNSDSPFTDVGPTTYWSLCRRHGKMSYGPLHRSSTTDLFILVNDFEQSAGNFSFQSTGLVNSKEETVLRIGKTVAYFKREGSIGQWTSGDRIIGQNISSIWFRIRFPGTSST